MLVLISNPQAYRAAGNRVVRSFASFTEAKAEAVAKLCQTSAGNVTAGLSSKQSAAAIAIRQTAEPAG